MGTAPQRHHRRRRPAAIESKALRLSAVGISPKPSVLALELVGGDPAAAQVSEGEVWFDGGWHATRYYSRDLLAPGMDIAGPAIVEQYDSTTVVPPGSRLHVDNLGNLVMTFAGGTQG